MLISKPVSPLLGIHNWQIPSVVKVPNHVAGYYARNVRTVNSPDNFKAIC
jgi:hypothetical protein